MPADLASLDGGALSVDYEAEEEAAWLEVVEGYKRAINRMSPDHPRRLEWLSRLRFAAGAARVDLGPRGVD